MNDRRHIVDRRLDAPADAVLAAIRDAIAATRFTDLPKPVRRHARRLTGKVRGARFTVGIEMVAEGDVVDLQGAVLTSEDGVTRVHASAEPDRYAVPTVAAMLALAGLMTLFRVGGAGWIAGFAALVAFGHFIGRGAGGTNDARAACLAEWLNGVLDRFPAADAPASARPSAPPHAHEWRRGMGAVSSGCVSEPPPLTALSSQRAPA